MAADYPKCAGEFMCIPHPGKDHVHLVDAGKPPGSRRAGSLAGVAWDQLARVPGVAGRRADQLTGAVKVRGGAAGGRPRGLEPGQAP
jgi:hypothetical protein